MKKNTSNFRAFSLAFLWLHHYNYGDLVVLQPMESKQHNTSGQFSEELLAYLEHATPALQKYALYLTNDRDDAKDLYQETIEKILKKYTMFREKTNFVGWAKTIMKRTFLNLHIRSDKKRTLSIDDLEEKLLGTGSTTDEDLFLKEIDRLMIARPDLLQELFRRYINDGMTYGEIAKKFGISESKARRYINKAKTQLIRELESMGYLRPTQIKKNTKKQLPQDQY